MMHINPDEFLWVEKYRPNKLEDCILPDRLKNTFQEYVNEGRLPNLLFTGTAGIGKTTVAKALCKEIGCDYLMINSSEERGIDVLRTKITQYASTVSLSGGPKVIILDEADHITADAQAALRAAMEEFSLNTSFILTCNFPTKLIEAIHSRCPNISFNLDKKERPEMATKFAKRLVEILNNEKIGYSKTALYVIIQKYFPDYRRILGEVQKLSKINGIQDDIVKSLLDSSKMEELFGFLKNKDFNKMRLWVHSNMDDHVKFFKIFYEFSIKNMNSDSLPQCVVHIAKYQYQSAFVSDQEVNVVAFLTEILSDCDIG